METRDLATEAGQNGLLVEIHQLAHRFAKEIIRPRYVAAGCAEEVAQDVVLDCLIRLREGRWDTGGYALDVHIKVLVRRRWNTIRRQRRAGMERDMIFLRDLDASVRPWMDPETNMENTELESLWAATFAKLPPMRRAAFELVRHRKWSYARAAERLGITPAGVHSHVVRAQSAFRAVLGGRGVVMPLEKVGRPRRGRGWRPRKPRRVEVPT